MPVMRKMLKSDWKRVSEIYSQAIDSGKATFKTVCPTYSQWDKSHLKECRFVIIENGIVEGWCAISAMSQTEAYKGSVEESIYIDEHFKNKHFGTFLLDRLCMKSKEIGIWSLYACIFSSNASSIALHKKLGFREIGFRKMIAKDKFGEWQDTTLMERRNEIV